MDICIEIPFREYAEGQDPTKELPLKDVSEGACADTVTHKSRLVDAVQWAKDRPYMLMIHAKHWTKIKLKWLEGCRLAIKNRAECDLQVNSIDKLIFGLDEIVKKMIPMPVKK